MKNIFRLSGGFFLVAALTAMLTACPSPTGPGGTTGGGNGEGGNGGGGNGQEEQTDNIVFPTLNANMTQAEISAHIGTAMNDLVAQAENIRDDYATWREELSKMPKSDAINKALFFTGGIINTEENFMTDYKNSNVNSAIFNANVSFEESVNLIKNIYLVGGSTYSRNVFAGQTLAFRNIKQLQQIQQPENIENVNLQLTDNYKFIEDNYGTRPQGSLAQQIASLRQSIIDFMPSACGSDVLVNKLIQQWEDTAQFEGWTEDIVELFGERALTRGGQRSVSYDAGSNTITMGK